MSHDSSLRSTSDNSDLDPKEKTKKKKREKMRKIRKKEPKEVPPEMGPKIVFYIRTVKRNEKS